MLSSTTALMLSIASTTPRAPAAISWAAAAISVTWPTVASTAVRISPSAAPAWSAFGRALARPSPSRCSIAWTASLVPAWTSRISSRDRLGLALGALGQLADLVGHHREAPAVLAGPGRLDGRVQGQQVGLLGDVVDRLDHRADLLAQLAQLLDLARRPRRRPA